MQTPQTQTSNNLDIREQLAIYSKNMNWQNLEFSKPNSKIRLGTLFSGIGAIEQAFNRLNLNQTFVQSKLSFISRMQVSFAH